MKKILLASFLLLSSFVAQADFATGKQAFKNGNYRQAFQELRGVVGVGHGTSEQRSFASYCIGYMYLKGLGTEQDFDLALSYLTESARMDFPHAFVMLGAMYINGEGVQKDLARGRAYLELAGDYRPAQIALAQLKTAGVSILEAEVEQIKQNIMDELKPVENLEIDAKPIIYLYPEEITNVTVALGYLENTTHTYPKYKESWQVQAEPNGDLTDLKTGRHYYALYWEGKNTVSTDTPAEGFIIKGSDTISFLEEKLDQLGLTEREAEEFIVYWLPKLESSPYNFIRFQTLAEQNKNMPLNITPAPKTLIRVMMEYDNLDKPIKIKKQALPRKTERNGFTVVEWGGTKLNLKEK